MTLTTQSLPARASGVLGRSANAYHCAFAFTGGMPPVVDLQAHIEPKGPGQRSCVTARHVPRVNVVQILQCVLALPHMLGADADQLRVQVRRSKIGNYEDDYDLALALAMVSSLVRRAIAGNILFIGGMGLRAEILSVRRETIDALNDAVDSFQITSPLRVICSSSNAVWINRSSTCSVVPVNTLTEAIAAVWPGIAVELRA